MSRKQYQESQLKQQKQKKFFELLLKKLRKKERHIHPLQILSLIQLVNSSTIQTMEQNFQLIIEDMKGSSKGLFGLEWYSRMFAYH